MPQADPMAEDWAAKNRWFGTDRAMTFTAFEIHKDLVDKEGYDCLLYTSPSPRDGLLTRMPSSA